MTQLRMRVGVTTVGLSVALFIAGACNRSVGSPPGQAVPLTLIYTTMVQGEVKDCGCPHHVLGGLARRAQYVADLRAQGKTVLQVDAGDGFFPYTGANPTNSPRELEKAKVIARSLDRMEVDAVNVGQLDLGAGLEFLQNQLNAPYSLPLISSNLLDKQKQQFPFPRHKIIERNGAKIGVFGLLQTPPIFLADRLEAKDPTAVAQEMISELRSKCDLIICLASLEFNAAAQLAQQVPGIDIMVASRGGRTTPQPFLAQSTLVVQAGNRGKYLGRMDLTLQPGAYNPKANQEREKLLRQEKQLLAQRRILEGPQLETNPELKAKYEELGRESQEVAKRLETLRGGFENKNSMVEVELSLPEDPKIAEWVSALFDAEPPLASPAPH